MWTGAAERHPGGSFRSATGWPDQCWVSMAAVDSCDVADAAAVASEDAPWSDVPPPSVVRGPHALSVAPPVSGVAAHWQLGTITNSWSLGQSGISVGLSS
ncbi:hypothetical protein [Rhodopila sp.]|uniref:hypothetical protein n=1 Tax=Rhodopila sp. TaxID=2480087 RepID=UPI003D09604A